MDSADDPLQARLAAALLRNHGELIVPLGAHPSPTHVYNDPAVSAPPIIAGAAPVPASNLPSNEHVPVTGEPLTSDQLSSCISRLRASVEPIHGQVSELYRAETAQGPYGCWMVRLTPRGVEEITEVRVAVVGNVDAGKSTTLGVLTRGALDDGRGKVCI